MAEWPTNKGLLLFEIKNSEMKQTLYLEKPKDTQDKIKFTVKFAFQIDPAHMSMKEIMDNFNIYFDVGSYEEKKRLYSFFIHKVGTLEIAGNTNIVATELTLEIDYKQSYVREATAIAINITFTDKKDTENYDPNVINTLIPLV